MTKTRLTSIDRTSYLHQAAGEVFDMVVIGGGITGAGIALDAESRGLKTILIEKQDFAAGTSSRSTKLIHGGLRYLKNMEFGLVHEVGSERSVIYKNAPHLVVPEKMLLPLVQGGSYGKLLTSLGLWLYDILAGVKKHEKRKMLSAPEVSMLEPLLRKDILKGGGLYVEYRTDDARLTLEIIKTAVSKGAYAFNYLRADSFVYENKKIVAVECTDQISREKITFKARQFVNACGPWVDDIRKTDQSLKGKRLHLTKGVHIVFPYDKLPVKHSMYFDTPDGRMIFAIPRGEITYVGTTDTNYSEERENPVVTMNDVQYLLKAVNHMFPEAKLTPLDVISSWAGLRPLIHEDGKSPSELSRKDEIFISPSGLISIAGGKLTGYRKMAERVVDLVMQNISELTKRAKVNCKTEKMIIIGGEFNTPEEVNEYIETLYQKTKTWQYEKHTIEYLVRTYGKQSEEILQKALGLKNISPEEALIKAELCFTLEYEAVSHLTDFFVRRTGRLYFNIHSVIKHKEMVLQEMKNYFHWNEATVQEESEQLEQALIRAQTFN